MHSLCRKKEVAFLGKVDYFTGTMLCLIPKEKVDLKEVCAYLNSEAFQKNYMYSGRFKIGQRQLLNAPLPI
jgi:adenine-specific DNA-methyltransferase